MVAPLKPLLPRVPTAKLRTLLLLLSLLLSSGAGCGDCGSGSDGADGGAKLPTEAPQGPDGQALRTAVSFIDALPLCDIDHRGLLLDLGTEAMAGRYGWKLEAPSSIVATEHDGATWARVYDRELRLSFYLPQLTPLFVSLRAIGTGTRRVGVTLDGMGLGSLKLNRKTTRIVRTPTTRLPVDAGLHHLKLYFRGRKGSDADPYAEIDWVRIGIPDELRRTYGAPTRYDVLVPAAQLGGVPHRAIALRAPGVVRCTVRVPPHGRWRTSVGMRGSGNASVALMVRHDDTDALLLERLKLKGGPDARWTDLDVSLHRFASRVVTLELVANKTTGTGRLMFGDPAMYVPARPTASTPKARTVVLVVLDGVEKSDLPPWRTTATPHLPTMNKLVKMAAVFDEHRSASTLVSAAVASLLTGLSPRMHGLADGGARLPKSVVTIGDIARDASVRAGMFTGVPTTFASFGFESHWESFTQYPPNEGRRASAPFDDAGSWLTDTAKKADTGRPQLVVIHARGGHPPWDITPLEAAKLPPPRYTGYLRPRDAAQRIAELRGRHSKLSEADGERLRAMFFAGLHGQDASLGKLITRLQDAGRWDSTLLFVMGDVASGRRTLFADGLELDEELLNVPLYVHFPAGLFAGERVKRSTELVDITRTALLGLGLQPPDGIGGRDLASLAGGINYDAQRIRVAITNEHYSARWGPYVLLGGVDKRPRLCHLSVDPTCQFDRSGQMPIATQALFRHLVMADRHRGRRPTREPLSLDSHNAAMLKVWGLY